MKKFQLTKLAMALVVIMFGFQAFAQGRIDLNGAKSAQQCTNVTKDGFEPERYTVTVDGKDVTDKVSVTVIKFHSEALLSLRIPPANCDFL